jgi:hypothetical protein
MKLQKYLYKGIQKKYYGDLFNKTYFEYSTKELNRSTEVLSFPISKPVYELPTVARGSKVTSGESKVSGM